MARLLACTTCDARQHLGNQSKRSGSTACLIGIDVLPVCRSSSIATGRLYRSECLLYRRVYLLRFGIAR
jgi:hypothetical protein